MINSNIINNRQNQDLCLKIQYAARKYFNAAEKINYLSWGFCILAALMFFIPDSTAKFITIGFPVLLEIATFVTTFIFNYKLKNAAKLRNYFDSYVLMIKEDEYSTSEKQRLKELAFNIYQNNQTEAQIIIHNTGHDNPPGVHDWYEFKSNIEGLNSQYECQRQNIWWNKKMVKNRLICSPLIIILLLVLFILMFVFLKPDIWNVIACFLGVVIKIIERIIEHYKYHVISIKIETIHEHIENQLTTDNIEKLQNLINKRRSIPVLEINLAHKKRANKYSDSYEQIS